MRTLTALLVVMCLVSAASAQPVYTLIDDMESYIVGASIHGQGGWQVQRNSSAIGDTGYCLALDDGTGNVVADLENRDLDGGIDTVFMAYELGVKLSGEETLKLTFRADGWNDTIMGTNDLNPGWTDLDEDGNIDDGGQAAGNYSGQAAMVVLRADSFRARDGGGYVDQPDVVQAADTWYDLYMLIDAARDKTMYAICPAGDEPSTADAVASPNGSLWWGHRNTSYDGASSLKFLFGGGAWPPPDGGWTEEMHVQIDDIQYLGIYDPRIIPEPATLSLLALGGLGLIRRRR